MNDSGASYENPLDRGQQMKIKQQQAKARASYAKARKKRK